MEVRLFVKKGRTTASQLAIHKFPTVIGRHRDCNLRIAARQVSRRHCVLKLRDGWLFISDLESCNGTVVNGRPVRGDRALHPGDVLEIGPITFEVSYTPPEVALTSGEAADTLVMSQATEIAERPDEPVDNAYEISERMREMDRARMEELGAAMGSSDRPPGTASDSDGEIVLLGEDAANLSPTKRRISAEVADGDTVHRRS